MDTHPVIINNFYLMLDGVNYYNTRETVRRKRGFLPLGKQYNLKSYVGARFPIYKKRDKY